MAAELAELLNGESMADQRGFLTEPLEVSHDRLTLGVYVLERPLGEGGMGSVWLAHRSDAPDHRVAVKLLNFTRLGAVGEERFRREGMALARLDHPGIARFHEAGVGAAGQPYLVLEYVDGAPIDIFARDHALGMDQRIRLVLQVLAAVDHAHAHRIVHRDLKPSNILVSGDSIVKLLDFGIAKLLDDGKNGAHTTLTVKGGHAFTPEFAAPEQIRGSVISAATDIYALGVLLYVLVAGRHPTAEGRRNPGAAILALLEAEPAPIEPPSLDRVVQRALRKAPEERYQTAAAFADGLSRYLENPPAA
jgi:serine/threonine protein kinase